MNEITILVEKSCLVCGDELLRLKGTFCSKKCQIKWHKLNRVELKCLYCQNSFNVIKSMAKRSKYCSRKCYRKATTSTHNVKVKKFKEFLSPKKKDPIIKKMPNHLARAKAIQQRDMELMPQIVVMLNSEVKKWELKIMKLVAQIKNSLNGRIEKMQLRYGSVIVTPKIDMFKESMSIIKQHINLAQLDGQKIYSVLEIE